MLPQSPNLSLSAEVPRKARVPPFCGASLCVAPFLLSASIEPRDRFKAQVNSTNEHPKPQRFHPSATTKTIYETRPAMRAAHSAHSAAPRCQSQMWPRQQKQTTITHVKNASTRASSTTPFPLIAPPVMQTLTSTTQPPAAEAPNFQRTTRTATVSLFTVH
jgi:hypothetical protein